MELETSELHANVNDLQKKLTQKMKGNEDLVTLTRGYKAKLQSKDRDTSELQNKHDEYCSKVTTLQSDRNIAATKLKKISGDYNDRGERIPSPQNLIWTSSQMLEARKTV
jgi:chromosome segregation ATPase